VPKGPVVIIRGASICGNIVNEGNQRGVKAGAHAGKSPRVKEKKPKTCLLAFSEER